MSTLIVIGNTNVHTFANSIVIANEKSKELFNKKELKDIHVFHTQESAKMLLYSDNHEWKEHLEKNLIYENKFIHRNFKFSSETSDIEALEDFSKDIEEIIMKNKEIIIDISNGTIFHRNLLAIISYILNIKHQYIIDIRILSKKTSNRGFLDVNDLKESYIKIPESQILDSIAYLDLTEIKRYKKKVDSLSKKFKDVLPEKADVDFFKQNLFHSIEFKLRGDKTKDNALYRISSSALASSSEELVGLILEKHGYSDYKNKTFGQKLNMLRDVLDNIKGIDHNFLSKFNDFILFLRNTTIHKSKELSNIEKFKSELSVSMTLEFIELYSNRIYHDSSKPFNKQELPIISYLTKPDPEEIYYFGIDGDNTGACLENLLINGDEKQLKQISNNIVVALKEMGKLIKKISNENEIIFQTGDDLLIKGKLNYSDLEKIQAIYKEKTKILSCSIGYGKTLKDTYLALKLAKAKHKKNNIRGILSQQTNK